MATVSLSAYDLAHRFLGLHEGRLEDDNPQVLAMLRLDAPWVHGDDTAWCSAFVNYICWLLDLPRSKSLAARSWLGVGRYIAGPGMTRSDDPDFADPEQVDFDVVILKRGGVGDPGPDVLDAPGHVGFYAGMQNGRVLVLAGNQQDGVSIAAFPLSRVLGVRRLLD